MSGGLADISQLKTSQRLIQNTWDSNGLKQSLAVLHCVSGYPVPSDQLNLSAIGEIRGELGCTVGYSDHSLGIDAVALSVALGARIIEKHFTIDKKFSNFRDHQLSADPAEMRLLIWKVEEVSRMLGSGVKVVQEVESQNCGAARRTIVASHDLAEGTVISLEDITWIRPAVGLAPGEEDLVLGKYLSVSIPRGEPILPGQLTDHIK